MYPLVRELAVQDAPVRVPVTVTCRVLKIARAPYYRWLANPVTDADWAAAHRANALFDAHRDDPEFGYRLLADEARDAGQDMCDRTAWAICSGNAWWSVFGKKRSTRPRPGPPAHDDRVQRDFTATGPNQLWLTDITEHRTREGKVYMCAVKDVWSNRLVGYAISSRMKARLAVQALEHAVDTRARAGVDVAGCIVHSDRGSQGGFNRSSQHRLVRASVVARRRLRLGSSSRGLFVACC
jgi:putative transposase